MYNKEVFTARTYRAYINLYIKNITASVTDKLVQLSIGRWQSDQPTDKHFVNGPYKGEFTRKRPPCPHPGSPFWLYVIP